MTSSATVPSDETAAGTKASAGAQGTGGVRTLVFLRDRGIILLWVVLVAFFALWAKPYFFTWTNAGLVANAAAISAVFAAAVAFGVLSGALDLSVPGTAALAAVVAGRMLKHHAPTANAVIAAVAVGAAVGVVNGVLVRRGLNPLVVTIATLTTAGGLANVVSGGVAVQNLTQLRGVGNGHLWGVPSMVFVVAGLYAVAWLFLSQTRAGARLQAVGGNIEAVRRAGINADRYRILGFVLSGVCAALGGLAVVAYTLQASPSGGVGVLFAALTAVAISGMPLSGGRGSLPRVLVGTLIIASINSALVIRHIKPYWTDVVTGVLLVLALVFEKVMTGAVTARLTADAQGSGAP